MASYTLDTNPWAEQQQPITTQPTEGDAPWPVTTQTRLSPSEIKAHTQRAQRSVVPSVDPFTEFSLGAAGIPRYLMGQVSPETSARMFPMRGVDKGGLPYIAGTFADPVALYTGTKGFQAVKQLPGMGGLFGNIAGGAASGAAVGSITEDQTALAGGAMGGALGALAGPASYIWSRLAGVIGDKTTLSNTMKYLEEAFPDAQERMEVADRIRNTLPSMPGEQVTTGMAAVGKEGEKVYPKLKELEQQAASRGNAATVLANILNKNREVRAAALDWIIKPGQRPTAAQGQRIPQSMAESARSSITEPLYKKASTDLVPVDETLTTLLDGPLVKRLASKARTDFEQLITNAQVAGRVPPKAGTAAVPSKRQPVPEWSMSAPYAEKAGKPAEISIGLLQDLRQDMTKRSNTLAKSSASADVDEKRMIDEANRQLDQWMRTKSQSWGDAQDTFKFLSEPQNQADVAQVLKLALQSPAGASRDESFLKAVFSSGTLEKAGLPRYEQISQVLSPTQHRNVLQLAESARRSAAASNVPSSSGILPKQQSTLQDIEAATPPLLSAKITAFRKLLTKEGATLTKEAERFLDNIVVSDPQALAKLLDGVSNAQKQAIMTSLQRRKVLGATVGSVASGTRGNADADYRYTK